MTFWNERSPRLAILTKIPVKHDSFLHLNWIFEFIFKIEQPDKKNAFELLNKTKMQQNISSRCHISQDVTLLKRKLIHIQLENINLLNKQRANKVITDDLTSKIDFLRAELVNYKDARAVVHPKGSALSNETREQVMTPKSIVEAPANVLVKSSHLIHWTFFPWF